MKIKKESDNAASLVIPNVDFHEFLENGFFHPVKWQKYIELARQFLAPFIYNPVSDAYAAGLLESTGSTFLIKSNFVCFPEALQFLNSIKSNRHVSCVNSVKMTLLWKSIKNTSYLLDMMIQDTAGSVLAATSTLSVLVNPVTKVPMPFPPSIKEFINTCTNAKDFVYVTVDNIQIEEPENAKFYQWSRKITMLDTDVNRHANNSVHVGLCLDCLGSAMAKQFPLKFKGCLHDNVIKDFSLVLNKEIKLDETVVVKMCEVSSRENMQELNFFFCVKDNRVASLSLNFFDPEGFPKVS